MFGQTHVSALDIIMPGRQLAMARQTRLNGTFLKLSFYHWRADDTLRVGTLRNIDVSNLSKKAGPFHNQTGSTRSLL